VVTLEEIDQQLATPAEEHEMMRVNALLTSVVAIFVSLLFVLPAAAAPFTFNTGAVTNSMAAASRPESAGKFEIESADDFFLTSPTSITSATFTGLLTGGATTANIGEVRIEIYRVFPADSDVARTSGPPTFSTPQVPTRVNSPSDVEFDDRDTSPPPGNLKFTTTVLNGAFTALNSVQPGGIHPFPNQTTGGDKAIAGQEVEFDVTFTTPFSLPPDHYFFVPQVEITTASGEFLWLSGTRPLVPSPFPAGVTDLQSWTRDDISPNNLAPDWLRIGTDIVGGTTPPTFNAAFSLAGQTIPGPATWWLVGLGMVIVMGWPRPRV
jgi:hypothetical protein